MIRIITYFIVACWAGCVWADDAMAPRPVNVIQTKEGVSFAFWGDKPRRPAPTVFIFANTARETLGSDYYRQCCTILAKHGFLCVSVDLPGHGGLGPHDTGELAGWRAYTEAHKDFVAEYNKKLKKVLDYLIAEGYTDPHRIVACGTSRGGYIALQFAADDRRVQCAAAFAPVTDLAALSEFRGADKQPLVQALSLANQAERLAGRPLWVAIGVHDPRVGTDRVVAFGKAVGDAAAKKKLPSRFVIKIDPKTIKHTTPKGAAEAAAAWIEAQLP